MVNNRNLVAARAAVVMVCLSWFTSAAASDNTVNPVASTPSVARVLERGRYLVLIGHCNNCHTSGYAASQGNVPESQWLLGNPVGYRGPFGTTYASNLRLSIRKFTEDQWVAYAKSAKPRPPMPWWSLQATEEQDLRAMYRFIRHLGPGGKPEPQYVSSDREPSPPYETRQVVKDKR